MTVLVLQCLFQTGGMHNLRLVQQVATLGAGPRPVEFSRACEIFRKSYLSLIDIFIKVHVHVGHKNVSKRGSLG